MTASFRLALATDGYRGGGSAEIQLENVYGELEVFLEMADLEVELESEFSVEIESSEYNVELESEYVVELE